MGFRGRKRWKTSYPDSTFSSKRFFTGIAKIGISLLKASDRAIKKQNSISTSLSYKKQNNISTSLLYFNLWKKHFINGYNSNNKQMLNYLIKQKPKTYHSILEKYFLGGEYISLIDYMNIKSNDMESFTKIYNAITNVQEYTTTNVQEYRGSGDNFNIQSFINRNKQEDRINHAQGIKAENESAFMPIMVLLTALLLVIAFIYFLFILIF